MNTFKKEIFLNESKYLNEFYLNEKTTSTKNVDEYFLPLDMTVDRTCFEWLVSGLKTSYDNLGILHRNLIGPGFFTVHELLESYYKKIGEMIDEVVEIGIRLGNRELSISECVKICPSLKVVKFDCIEALRITQKIFEMLIEGFLNCNENMPDDVESKFDEHILWLQQEGFYKIKHYLEKK